MGGEVEVLYLHTMKKQLFFLFLLLFSTLSFAQSSLDSLRLVLPEGHSDWITHVNLNSEGNLLLTSSVDGSLKLFDFKGRRLISEFVGKVGPIEEGYISPTNELLISRGWNGFKLWDLNSGQELNWIDSMNSTVNNVEFSANGKFILICHTSKVCIYNVETKSLFRTILSNESKLIKSNFSNNSKMLLLLKDSNIEVYDFLHDTLIFNISNQRGKFTTSSFSKDDNLLTASSTLGEVSVFDLQTRNKIRSFLGHDGEVVTAVFSNNGKLILSCGIDNTARIWELESHKMIILKGHKDYVTTALFSKNDEFVCTGSFDRTAKVWDSSTGKIIHSFDGHDGRVMNVVFSADNKYVLTASGPTYVYVKSNPDFSVKIWEVGTGSLKGAVSGSVINQSNININNMNSNVLVSSRDSHVYMFDYSTGIHLQHFGPHNYNILNAVFNTFSNSFTVADFWNLYHYDWDSIRKKYKYPEMDVLGVDVAYPICNIRIDEFNKNQKLIVSYLTGSSRICTFQSSRLRLFNEYSISESENWDTDINLENSTAISITGDSSIILWDLRDGRKLKIVRGKNLLSSCEFNFNGTEFITSGNDSLVSIWNSKKFEKIKDFKGHHGEVLTASYSENNNLIVSGSYDNSGIIWKKNGTILHKLIGHKGYVSVARFCNNDKSVITIGNDRRLILWDVASGNPIYERIQLLNNNWLVKLPNSPYYMCSKDASKMLHYVTPSLKVIGFEQLDPVYNRPDIVLDSIGKYFGNSDGGMIDEYRKSWEKRIDRLGLDKEKLGKGEIAVPNAEIVDADNISFENKVGKLNIRVSANDPKYPLRRFNVFVNEVPLYGSAGISIAHLKKQVWDTTVSVPLSVGENKIQVSVMNELGLENFKYPTYVNYTPTKEIVAKTHYIGIGVNEFKESSHNLKYCVKDVRDLAREFASENKNVDTLLFTDQQVTKENILALKDYLNKTCVNDKVIISCSSHGLLDDSLNFYLAMHDVDFNNPKARGLKYEALESLLDGIPARQKLLLLDACNSGENDKTEVLKQELQQKEKNMDSSQVLAARGVIIKLEEENKSNFKKMNELFVNVRNNTGSVIISAAGGQESALEAIEVDGKTIENGAFTYSILECLKQNEGKELKVNALKQYGEKRVEEITNGKQKPTSRQETMEVDWGVR